MPSLVFRWHSLRVVYNENLKRFLLRFEFETQLGARLRRTGRVGPRPRNCRSRRGACNSPSSQRSVQAMSCAALRGRRHIADPRTRYRSGGGPRSLTQREQVGVLGYALGRPLRFDEIAPETARRDGHDDAGCDRGMPLNAWPATVGKPAPITSTVAEITGVPARFLYDWVVDHAAELN